MSEWNSAIKAAQEVAHIHTCDGCGDEVDEKIAALMRSDTPPVAPPAAASTTEAKLKEFFTWAMNYAWGGDIDGADVQARALKLGLIQQTTYDPEKHGPLPEEFEGLVDPGDEWFVFAPEVKG